MLTWEIREKTGNRWARSDARDDQHGDQKVKGFAVFVFERAQRGGNLKSTVQRDGEER